MRTVLNILNFVLGGFATTLGWLLATLVSIVLIFTLPLTRSCWPTSFYRHFRDVDELGLTMVDESGLMLRQLMRQARQRIAKGGSVIRTSVSTFMEFIGNNPNDRAPPLPVLHCAR